MATSSGEASLTSDLGRNSTSETVQRATEGARAGSLAAGAWRSRPPAAPAQQCRAAAAHGAGRRPPPPSVHRPPPHAPAGCLHLRPPVEAGCRRPGERPAGGAAAEGRGGLRVCRARRRREVLPPRAARGGLQRCTRRPDGRTGRWGDGRQAAGRRAQRPEDEATSCGRRRRVGAGGAVASRGWLGLLAKRPPNPTQTLGCAGLKPEASRSPILGPRATKSRPSTRLPVFLSNFSVVLASGRRRRDLLPSRRRGELRSEDILYCSAKGT